MFINKNPQTYTTGEGSMPKKTLKIVPLLAAMLTALLVLTMLALPVSAKGDHLWFYSVDPATLPGWTGKIDGSVNPEDDDPNYVDFDPDPWLKESVVLPKGDWDTPFSLWIGNADHKDTSYGTTLVISVNDAAAKAIDSITVTPGGTISAWNTNPAQFPLPPHGISNSDEYHGFAEVIVGDIGYGSYIVVKIDITLKPEVDQEDLEGAKIHFDAYGWSNQGHVGILEKADMNSPFSKDYTFVIPELATILLTTAPLSALGIYAFKRKRK
jgi:hypothetical protein